MKFVSTKVLSSEEQSLVSIDDAKAQLYILDDENIDSIKQAIDSAFSYAETYLWRSLRPQKIIASYDLDGRNFAEIIRGGKVEIENIKFYNTENELEEIENFALVDNLAVPRVYFNEPSNANTEIKGAIQITYNTDKLDYVEPEIKQAILIALGCFYDDRNAPNLDAVDKILNPLKTRYLL